jgi:hypothetical protein
MFTVRMEIYRPLLSLLGVIMTASGARLSSAYRSGTPEGRGEFSCEDATTRTRCAPGEALAT